MGESRWIHIDFDDITKETDNAFLVVLEDGEQVWLPKSQISDADDYEVGDSGTMSITEWIAEQKGIS